jgi:CrcB protein
MKFPLLALFIGLAGFIGSLSRWLLGRFVGQINVHFPLSTLIINITGSCFLGWFYAHARKHHFSDATLAIIGTGFVGAYTTFSTYMYESNDLMRNGADIKAALNLLGSIVLGLAGVRLGIWLAQYT